MPRRHVHLAVFAWLFLTGATAAGASPVFVGRDALARRLAEAPSETFPASTPIDAARLDAAAVRAATDPVVGEWALRGLVVALARQEPGGALRARVEALTHFAPQAWTEPPDPDHARGARVPVADVAAAARRTLRAWRVAELASGYRLAWSNGARPAPPLDAEAATRALAAFDDARLEAVLVGGADALPIEVLASVAGRTRDPRVSARVLSEGRGPASLAFVAGLAAREPTAAALAHLRRATANPALATAACRGLAALAPRTPAAYDALFALLSDAQAGPSAAEALAALGDAATLARLDEALERTARASTGGAAPTREMRRLLLVLQRLPDAQGAARLARVVDDQRLSPALRAEMAGWRSP